MTKSKTIQKTGNQFNDCKFVQLCFYKAYIFLPLESVIKYTQKLKVDNIKKIQKMSGFLR